MARSPWLAQIAALLGDAPGTALPLGDLRYERVLLLMDPDADGIHAPALLERCCVNPATRLAHPLRVADAALAVQVFAAGQRHRPSRRDCVSAIAACTA